MPGANLACRVGGGSILYSTPMYTHIRRLPQDPWGNEYQLLSPGQHGAIDVFSVGPDGMPDTNDDIGNWTLGKK